MPKKKVSTEAEALEVMGNGQPLIKVRELTPEQARLERYRLRAEKEAAEKKDAKERKRRKFFDPL